MNTTASGDVRGCPEHVRAWHRVFDRHHRWL